MSRKVPGRSVADSWQVPVASSSGRSLWQVPLAGKTLWHVPCTIVVDLDFFVSAISHSFEGKKPLLHVIPSKGNFGSLDISF